MSQIDALIVTALKEEHDAARAVASASGTTGVGVETWEKRDAGSYTEHLVGTYRTARGQTLLVALARPTRMGGTSTSPIVAGLVERLQPRCLAMCGVCAGNPDDVALGDVIVAEMVYAYDEGKRKRRAFEGDHRQTPMLDTWIRAAQELLPDGLPSFGPTSPDEATTWLLERLYLEEDPRIHPARARYFPAGTWSNGIKSIQQKGLVRRSGTSLLLTKRGRAVVEEKIVRDVDGPQKLPFQIKVGPIASGNVVVKDGRTWSDLKAWGVRSVLGLEMEAATIGSIAHRLGVPSWTVVKGVMDHADPRKDDRYKPFAARASAEVLFRLLAKQLADVRSAAPESSIAYVKRAYVIGGTTDETSYPAFEQPEFMNLCIKLGQTIARAGAELVVCSPFPDSADVYSVMGYVQAGVGGAVHFHSPRHPAVAEKQRGLQAMLGVTKTRIVEWFYPGPESDEAWGPAWLLCQLQALEYADVVIAIGGRLSKTASTILHLAEARRISIVPFAFMGGAAKRAFERQDWKRVHPGVDERVFLDKSAIGDAMKIANQLVADRVAGSRRAPHKPATLFISRASEDAEFADELVRRLSREGLNGLLGDKVLRDDRMVQPSIEEAVLRADVCVVLWSGAYARSRWCYDELHFALERARVGELQVWIFSLDGSDVAPREARQLPCTVARTPTALADAVLELIERSTPSASQQ